MASKRSHTKSRRGCKQCKQRKIKCDERPPCCGHCAKKGVHCEFRDLEGALQNIQLFTQESFNPKRAAPRSSEPETRDDTPSSSTTTPPLVDAAGYNAEDMGLLHHFTLYTSQTLGPIKDESYSRIWQDDIPRLAQSYPFLMHAVLAFAAAHQASSQPRLDPRCFVAARSHYSRALTLFGESVNTVEAKQADALFCYCVLISFLSLHLNCDKPVEERDGIQEFVEFLQMLHGSMAIIAQIQQPLQASPIGQLLSHARNKSIHAIAPDAEASLNDLEHLMSTSAGELFEPEEVAACNDALTILRRFYTLSYAKPDSWRHLLSCPISLGPKFTALLDSRNGMALCLLAHWCVAAYNAPHKWYVGDWPGRTMAAVAEQLHGSKWFAGLRWPLSMTLESSATA